MKLFSFIVYVGLIGCGSPGDIAKEIAKPLRSDSKLAYTIKKYQVTTCKEACLVEAEHQVERCYEHATGVSECVAECPLQYLQFLCTDLQKEEDDPQRYYVITPANWQKDVSHLAGYYFHEQIKKHIAQPEFMCEQDMAICENHFEVIEALQRFYYEK